MLQEMPSKFFNFEIRVLDTGAIADWAGNVYGCAMATSSTTIKKKVLSTKLVYRDGQPF